MPFVPCPFGRGVRSALWAPVRGLPRATGLEESRSGQFRLLCHGEGRALHRHENLIQLIRERAADHPDRPALVFCGDPVDAAHDEVLTYADVDRVARQVAALIQRRFTAGDRLLVVNRSGLGFAAGFLGCVYAGMIAVPAPDPEGYRRQQDRLVRIAEDAGAAGVLTDAADLDAVTSWAATAGLARLAAIACDPPELPAADEWIEPPCDAETLAFLQYTSGSTSAPKGVMIDHGNILDNTEVFRLTSASTQDTRFGGWLPMYHDFGLIGLLLVPLSIGARSIVMSPGAFLKRPHTWLRLIDRHRINLSPAPNFAYDLCVRRIADSDLAGVDLSSWTSAINGSEPIQARTVTAFAERFAAFGLPAGALTPGYGMAEATLCVSGSPKSHEPVVTLVDAARLGRHRFVPAAADHVDTRVLVSSGRAPGIEVRVVDPDMRGVLPDGVVGEIWVRGRSVARGYWRDEERTGRVFDAVTVDGESGFLRTGDLGVWHDGELYVTGRIKELLVVHGRNLYPQDLEAAARITHPSLSRGVGAVFTVGVPDEEIVVVQECRAGQLTGDELTGITRELRDSLALEFGVTVQGVVLVRSGSVPRTTSGKIQRSLARQLFLDGQMEPVHADLTPAVRAAVGAGERA